MAKEGLEELKFEQALERLREIVKLMESGNQLLDESLALFEEGVALVRICSKRLDEAEFKVKILSEKSLELSDFKVEDAV